MNGHYLLAEEFAEAGAERGLRDVRGSGLAVGAHRPRGQPGVGGRADGDQAGLDEPVLGQRAESGRARVGVR